jgi:hypothetical protein
MKIEELFNRQNIVDMSFFNFSNAITAAYFADKDLKIQKINANFKAFFPVLGNLSNAYFPDVLHQLGVDEKQIESFSKELEEIGHVLIPRIIIKIDGKERTFSLLSAKTRNEDFSYLNGVQGQFIDRTEEFELRREREELLEEKSAIGKSSKTKPENWRRWQTVWPNIFPRKSTSPFSRAKAM